jgi:hypothetical protein
LLLAITVAKDGTASTANSNAAIENDFWMGQQANEATLPENPNWYAKTDMKNHCVNIKHVYNDALICQYGEEGNGEGQFNQPYGVASVITSEKLFLFVAEYMNHRVQVLRLMVSTDGAGAHLAFVRFLGNGMGNGPGELSGPTWMVVLPVCPAETLVFVAEYGNRRVSRFNLEGHFLGYTDGSDYYLRIQ